MGLSVFAIALWVIACLAVARARPSQAYGLRLVLLICGVPLLGLITWLQGPVLGLIGLVAGTLALTVHRLPTLRRD